MPSRFESELAISGVLTADFFAFNSSLGATIEDQVTASLNELRSVLDPDNQYSLYGFERQPQTFPDVVLRTSAPDIEPPILMGIELKGWYVLAKEREPSFRYKVTPAACSPWTGNRNITPPEAITHYPIKRDMISDHPERDMGGNFGRFARTNAMNNSTSSCF